MTKLMTKPLLLAAVGVMTLGAGPAAAYDPAPDPRLSGGSGNLYEPRTSPRAKYYAIQARERSRSAARKPNLDRPGSEGSLVGPDKRAGD
ncbi:MAG: hypothetical protein ACU85V_20670 [Gammaproteobacteria bacterium]